MIPRKYNKSVEIRARAEGYCLCINNAIHLIDDAEILINNERYVGAINYLILANEEMAKAHLITQTIVFDDDDKNRWEWFWKSFNDHREKQRIIEYEFHYATYKNKNNFHERVKKVIECRENSIYIDFDIKSGKFITPEENLNLKNGIDNFTQAMLKYSLSILRMFCASGKPEPDIIEKYYKQKGAELKKKLNLSKGKKNINIERTNESPLIWLLDAEENYVGARCLLLNNILTLGIFTACRSIEKYLKTFFIIHKDYYPKNHELLDLYNLAVEEKVISIDSDVSTNINYFDELKNIAAYVEGDKRGKSSYGYGKSDYIKLDKLIFYFENILKNNNTIKGLVYPNYNIATINEFISYSKLPNDVVVTFNKKWLLELNDYFKIDK